MVATAFIEPHPPDAYGYASLFFSALMDPPLINTCHDMMYEHGAFLAPPERKLPFGKTALGPVSDTVSVFLFGEEVAAALHPDVPAHTGQAGEPQGEAPFHGVHAAPVKR
jgi:hypothetical protein